MTKSIAILGSTGSIGTQTLDVVRQYPDRFSVFMISANNSAELLVEQARRFHVPHVVICNPYIAASTLPAPWCRRLRWKW